MAGTTRLELSDKSSHKFWEVSTKGAQLVIRFGRIGSAGQTKLKTLATPAAAKAEAEKQIASKRKGGYTAPWYRAVLQEIDRFYRANGQKPRALQLRPAPGDRFGTMAFSCH